MSAGAGTGAGQGTISYETNNSGVSAGVYFDSSFNSHGFLRAADGTMTTFDVDGSLSQTFPTWMNDKGGVDGFYFSASAGTTEAFLRKPGGKIVTFDALGGNSSYTLCFGGNDRGVIVGQYGDPSGVDHGFLRAKDGTITSFDAPGAAGTIGYFVNVGGAAVGPYYDADGVNHAYIRAADGSFTEFDAPGARLRSVSTGVAGSPVISSIPTARTMASCATPAARSPSSTHPTQAAAVGRVPRPLPSTTMAILRAGMSTPPTCTMVTCARRTAP